ncbi:MAG: PcfK-like family protein [Clostridia bacterium]|nr:PcfK-like family protein [Clostridia bacterium]
MKLNLKVCNHEQELIKNYLEENASDVLCEKINNGVKITKDDKELINKKDLNDFMKYAGNEAKKLAEQGANCACIEDKIVYGWAIHYFEEDKIVGKFFNLDGSEYTPEIKTTNTNNNTIKTEPVKPKETKSQFNMFDFINNNDTEKVQIENKNTQNDAILQENTENIAEMSYSLEDDEKLLQMKKEMLNTLDEEDELFDDEYFNTKTIKINNSIIDTSTGEVLENKSTKVEDNSVKLLNELLENKLIVRI